MPKDAISGLMADTDARMRQAIEATKREYATIRTGRANPAVLDRVTVEYYGQKVPVKQVATVSVPEPRQLMITPWDKAMVKPIVDAITSSDLSLNPTTDGNVIRVPLPQLTTQRRQELVKLVNRQAEGCRVAVRTVRRETIEKLRVMQKSGSISEDDLHRFQEQVQKITDAHIEQVDQLDKTKAREIMET